MKTRISWIDQARGLSIFLVVYGHNYPVLEPYIYSFHVPLFFFISGMFHPTLTTKETFIKRTKTILLPYFIWASLLYLFWFFVGKNYGNSSTLQLSPLDNFIGIFYSQGGQKYMDWGIPLWFLPCIFLVFLLFSFISKLKNKNIVYLSSLFIVLVGFLWAKFVGIHLPWSIDVAMVALGFYTLGYFLFKKIKQLTKLQTLAGFVIFLIINIATFYSNPVKIDMYRSIYGNELLFFISGFSGALAMVLFFKLFPVFTFFSYLGKHTITILAAHLRALTVIKFILLLITGITVFQFSEIQKFILSIVQIILLIPLIWFVNKYFPVLDGKIKKH